MPTLDSILNFAIPTLLILIAIGFVYIKFLSPLTPQIKKILEWLQGNSQTQEHRMREITYE